MAIVEGLFGLTPEMYQREQSALADARALQYAKLDPFQQANFAIGRGANQLAGAIGGALGGTDPELQRITQRQQIASQINLTDPDSIQQGYAMLQQVGDTEGMQQLAQVYRQQQESGALINQRQAAADASTAQTYKIQLGIKQEAELRKELAALPPNATEDQIRGVLVKYGDPDKVLTALTSAATRAEDRLSREAIASEANQARRDAAKDAAEARVEAARIQAEARIDAARAAGANRLEIARIQAENRRELATLAASLKGPSAQVIKAQEKAEQVEEGKAVLGDIISTAKTLIGDLAKDDGITSTSAGPLANMITSTFSSPAGQVFGGVFGTKNQAKRDELKSIRLQLLNAVKQATGMSSQQLNSNVELRTYLDSLGSPGMTKEANEAILNNIERSYLKRGGVMPAPARGVDTSNPLLK